MTGQLLYKIRFVCLSRQTFLGGVTQKFKKDLVTKWDLEFGHAHRILLKGGGHYVSYSRAEENKWYCHNDSSCKEVPEANIDKSSAYILMYEREGLSLTDYLPDTTLMRQDSGDLDDELELDFKKQCSLM